MGDNHYDRFPGDYQRDTRHLSLAEHGAYCLLLDSYYSTGRPLPASVDALVRIVGAQGKAERESVERVIGEFFPVNGDGLRHNARADRELARRAEFLADQARKGRLSGEARRQQRFNRGSNSGSTEPPTEGGTEPPTESQPPSPSPSPVPQPTPTPHTPPRTRAREEGFAVFWSSYPRKVGREAALRAWVSVEACEHVDAIAEALAWQTESAEWRREAPRFIPKPENYLFERRWTDERPPDAEDGFLKAAKESG